MSLRRTALARKSELRRSTPMPRRTRETKARATKTVARQRAGTGPDAEARRLVLDRAGGCCERCLCTLWAEDRWVRPHSVHHRQPRGAGGTSRAGANSPANLLLLCGTGTTGCHGEVEAMRADAYERLGFLVRHPTDPATVPIALPILGRTYLTHDGRYSQEAPDADQD